jgi:DNA-binding MarR family transcriptional regulator
MIRQHYKVETYRARDSVGFLIKRAYALLLDNFEPAFTVRGFTFMQWVVLMQLRSGLALNLRDISSQFCHDSGALTRVVDQLVERGLVERQRAAQDRRKVDLHLTRAGLKRCEELIPLVVDKLNRALAEFSRPELAELIRLLYKFNTGLQTEVERESAQIAPTLRMRS